MVDAAVGLLRGKDAVPAHHVANRLGRAGKKAPARQVDLVRLGIVLQRFGRIVFGIKGD